MKNIIYLLVLIPVFYFSQINKQIKVGILTNALDEKVAFTSMIWKNDKAEYTNAKTNLVETLYETSIKSIEEVSTEDENFIKLSGKTKKIEEIKDNLYHTSLPEGIYKTKEDFIKQTPNKNIKITPRGLVGFTKPIIEDGALYCFFFDENESKINDCFAIVYKDFLYFRMGDVLKNKNKNDRAQDSDNPNAFSRVIIGGDNYLYTEAPLGNTWEKAFYVNYGVSTNLANYNKGIVWDFKNKEFNIFKNCDDYNEFIKDKLPNQIQKCPEKQPNNFKVREAIEIIK